MDREGKNTVLMSTAFFPGVIPKSVCNRLSFYYFPVHGPAILRGNPDQV
jgi:hypothetical protein